MKKTALSLISLLSFYITCCQTLTGEQLIFLKKNATLIYSGNPTEEPAWDFISQHIKNKRIILVGEFTHGAKEIFSLRNSLIKHLHQKTGAKVILFESGIGELINADINKATLSAGQLINGLFGPWRTKEFIELMEYVKTNNISISGFDIQRSGGSFAMVLNEVVQKYKVDSSISSSLESRFTELNRELTNRNAAYDSLKTKTEQLIADFEKVKTSLSAFSTKETKDILFTAITIENRERYLSYMLQFLKDKDWHKRWAARDSGMAINVQWLMDNIYGDQPIIIIGHNFHLAKHNEKETVMGEFLKTKYDSVMYCIGIFAGEGAHNDNFGKDEPMKPADMNGLDIKHVILQLPGAATFIPIPQKFNKGSNWLNRELIINDTFIDLDNSNKMILSKAFDGLILLNKISPAKVN